MYNFSYVNPTKIIFGKGAVDKIGEVVSDYGRKVLLVTGQGSIKKTGLYDKIIKLLKDNSLEIFELQGIVPNPRLSACEEGVKICKDNNIDVIAGVGGGSVVDTAKIISAGALDDGDIWDFFENKRKIKKALPVISVITVAASGSEYNHIAAIKNDRIHKKEGLWDEHLFPKVSLIDPQLTYSVSPKYTAFGGVDIISHVLERYVNSAFNPLIQMRFKESLITTVMESVEKAQENPCDYEARSYLMWASSLACSQFFECGNGGGKIQAHIIETELSGLYDTTHGAALAVILPAVMKYWINDYTPTLARFAEKVMKVERKGRMTDLDIANEGIEAFRRWLKKVGCPITIKELGLTKDDIQKAAKSITPNPGQDINEETVLGVLNTYFE